MTFKDDIVIYEEKTKFTWRTHRDFDGVKSQKSLVKKLAEYMYRNFRSAAVELAWNIGPSTTVMNVTTDKDNTLYKSTGIDLNQSAFSSTCQWTSIGI